VLQEREVVPLGGGKPAKVDFALIAASHKPLKAEVEAGRFRSDLYYRLNGLTLKLPALRARTDFMAIVARMLAAFEPDKSLMLAPDVAAAFARYRWPGNLRQLSNALLFACAVLDPGEVMIGWRHLPDDLIEDLQDLDAPAASEGCDSSVAASLRASSDSLIERAVLASEGNMSEAARRLGISRNTLYRRLKACPRPRPKTRPGEPPLQ
jgi:transcriptional regulator of acetoin/glycerol metabolism